MKEENKNFEEKTETSIEQEQSIVKEEQQNPNNSKKGNKALIFALLAIIVALIVVIVILLLGRNDKNSNSENKEKTNNNTISDNNTYLERTSDKIDFNSYCSSTGSCKKNIGIITIDGQELELSVDVNNINTNNVNGTISLGSNKIDVSKQGSNKSIDGFEIYKNYFILYLSDLDYEYYNYTCGDLKGLKYYTIKIFNSELKEVASLGGITKNNAFIDTKIEDNYLYYYTAVSYDVELGILDTFDYEKIQLDDYIVDGRFDVPTHVTISSTNCR